MNLTGMRTFWIIIAVVIASTVLAGMKVLPVEKWLDTVLGPLLVWVFKMALESPGKTAMQMNGQKTETPPA